MATRVWNFLLPTSGDHCLHATNLDSKTPTVILDGNEFPPQQARVFPGPDNSLLELQCINGSAWSLLVNGVPVEEYTDGRRASGDETLRELRSKPEGSYTISSQFDVSHLALRIVRKFRFTVGGNIHEVQISQMGRKDVVWQILLDGFLVERAARTFSDGKKEILFTLCVASGVKLNATLHTRWKNLDFCWQIMLTVNGIEVPVCWSIAGGEVQQPEPPEVPIVDSAEEAGQQEKLLPCTESEGEEEKEIEEAKEGAIPSTLPQGVSLDRTSGAYQATIRGKSGRFVFLGEFGTPEEAHQQYLMALQDNCSANMRE